MALRDKIKQFIFQHQRNVVFTQEPVFKCTCFLALKEENAAVVVGTQGQTATALLHFHCCGVDGREA